MEATSQKGSAITGSIKQHAAIQEYESDDELSTTRDINVSIIIPDIVVINDDAVNDVTGGLLPTSSTPAKVGKGWLFYLIIYRCFVLRKSAINLKVDVS